MDIEFELDRIRMRIKNRMEKRNVSQSELAELIETNQPWVSRYLNGKQKGLRLDTLIRILDALDLEISFRSKP